MSLDVTVNIKLAEVIGKSGTWFPCLYYVDESVTEDAYGEYTRLADLITAGYTETTEVYKAANMMFMQNDPPKKIAVLAQSAFSTSTMPSYLVKGWRQLVLIGEQTNVAAIAAFIETTDKMLFAYVDSSSETATTTLTTLYSSIKTYERTVVVYHSDPLANVAIVGATAGYAAGSFTYKNIIIKGIEPLDLSASEIEAIHEKGAITIVEKVGDIVTSDGIVASGQFIDIVDSKDYIIQNISYNTQRVFNINKKVPYTNAGIAMLEAATFEALKDGYNNGMIADNADGSPAYNTSFALRADTTAEDRAARHYPYGTFTFELAGAVHSVVVTGTISV